MHNGKVIATGYSGHPPHVNDPEAEALEHQGPIPRGIWTIGSAFAHAMCGCFSMRLIPAAGTNTHGRDGFLIHGPAADDRQNSSHGCIILTRPIRETISASGDRELHVVP
ncbi:MAG: tlde1 domain-containing protein [Acetobacteraceae bacterium]